MRFEHALVFGRAAAGSLKAEKKKSSISGVLFKQCPVMAIHNQNSYYHGKHLHALNAFHQQLVAGLDGRVMELLINDSGFLLVDLRVFLL